MKRTVLLVDDEVLLLDGLRDALRKQPFDIATASSAEEGLRILAARNIDVVISDERMPGMSGSEFLALVRQRHPSTVRIMLTGHASLTAAIRAINEGEIYRFLTKPCNPVQLAHTIRDALLLKDMVQQSARLLATWKEQCTLLDKLETQHPGITRVERSDDGSIVLDPAGSIDVGELIEEMRRELERPRR